MTKKKTDEMMDDWLDLNQEKPKSNESDLFMDQIADENLFDWDESDAGIDSMGKLETKDKSSSVNLNKNPNIKPAYSVTDYTKVDDVPNSKNLEESIKAQNIKEIKSKSKALLMEYVKLYGPVQGYTEFVKKTQVPMTAISRRRQERGS